MSSPRDDLMRYLAHARRLPDAAAEPGQEVPERKENCVRPSDLLLVALGEATAEQTAAVLRHVRDCDFCERSLQALRAAAAAEPVPPLPEGAEDAVAEWVLSDQPLTPKPEPAPAAEAGTYTLLARRPDPEAKDELLKVLRHDAPYWLRSLGLSDAESVVQELLAFVRPRLPIGGAERFRDVWPRWLGEFAAAKGGRPTGVITEEAMKRTIDLAALDLAIDSLDIGRRKWGPPLRQYWHGQVRYFESRAEPLLWERITARRPSRAEVDVDPLTLDLVADDLSWKWETKRDDKRRRYDLV